MPPHRLADAVAGARAMGWAGFNCSLPRKIAVIKHLDGLGESARLIGAVNCVVRDDGGRFIGENTDGKGFLRSLEEITPATGKRAVIFGAGGTRKAVTIVPLSRPPRAAAKTPRSIAAISPAGEAAAPPNHS